MPIYHKIEHFTILKICVIDLNINSSKCIIFDMMKRLIILIFCFSTIGYSQQDFGPPSNPTYGFVQPDIPQDYYAEAINLAGDDLKEALHQIIANHIPYPYTSSSTDTWDILQDSDQDPENNNNILLVYTNRSQDKGYRDGSGNYSQYENGNGTQSNSWNREHIWPKSHGFPNQDDIAYRDVHNLKPCDRSVNASRGVKDFDNGGNNHDEALSCLTDFDSWEPADFVKGDVARILFYMVVRYDPGYNYYNETFDLELVDYTTPDNFDPILGKLSTLLEWHVLDPVDDFEVNRNEVIYSYQQNRNPFIDHPELVDYIWGENNNQNWSGNLNTYNPELEMNNIYPNPTNGIIYLPENFVNNNYEVLDLNGKILTTGKINQTRILNFDLEKGVYFLKIIGSNKYSSLKLVIK
jgi:endonuclease I